MSHVVFPFFQSRPLVFRAGQNATYLYLATKILYVVSVMGQMYLMNIFMGGTYIEWGTEVSVSVFPVAQGDACFSDDR